MESSAPLIPTSTEADFRRVPGDFAVCAGCCFRFREAPDCTNCEADAHLREIQVEWWKQYPQLDFMGVNVGQVLSHTLRGVLGAECRKEE